MHHKPASRFLACARICGRDGQNPVLLLVGACRLRVGGAAFQSFVARRRERSFRRAMPARRSIIIILIAITTSMTFLQLLIVESLVGCATLRRRRIRLQRRLPPPHRHRCIAAPAGANNDVRDHFNSSSLVYAGCGSRHHVQPLGLVRHHLATDWTRWPNCSSCSRRRGVGVGVGVRWPDGSSGKRQPEEHRCQSRFGWRQQDEHLVATASRPIGLLADLRHRTPPHDIEECACVHSVFVSAERATTRPSEVRQNPQSRPWVIKVSELGGSPSFSASAFDRGFSTESLRLATLQFCKNGIFPPLSKDSPVKLF